MNLKDFQAMVDRLFVRRRGDQIEANMHACVGLSGESGECLDLVKKTWVMEDPRTRPLDLYKLQTEAGDVLHYLVMLCVANYWTLEDLAENNRAKLAKRYPNGYSDAANIARADVV